MLSRFKIPKLYQLGIRQPLLVLTLAFLVTLWSYFTASKLRLLTDFSSLLPQQTESVRNLDLLNENFGSLSHLVVTVEAEDPWVAEAFATEFAERIRQHPDIRYVDHKPPVDFFKKRQWFFIDIPDLSEMERRIDRSLILQEKGVSPVFSDLMDFADEENRPDLTFKDIREKYEEKIQLRSKSEDPNVSDDFEILWVKPKQPPDDIDYNRKLVANIKDLEAVLRSEGKFSSVKVGYTGSYQSSIEDIALTKREITFVSVVVTGLLFLILILYFRKLSAALLIGLPLTLSIAWTMAMVYLLLGHLNIITSFGAAILAGLGSDYGIFLLTRFYNEKAQGKNFITACDLAFGNTGRATFGSMVTTVGAFLALLFSKFGVFVEFGIVGALGLLMNYIGMMLLMPSLLCLANRWEKYPLFARLQRWDLFGREHSHLGSNFLQKVFTPKGAVAGLLLVMVLLVGSALTLKTQTQIYFEDGQINTEDLPSSKLNHRVSQVNWSTIRPAVLLNYGLEQEQKTVRQLDKLLKEKPESERVFKKIFGISSFMPDQTQEKREILKRIYEKFQRARLINPDQKAKTLQSLQDNLRSTDVTLENIPQEVKRRFQSKKNPDLFAVYLYPSVARSSSGDFEKYHQGIMAARQEAGTQFIPVDSVFVELDIINLIKKEAPRGMVLILLFFAAFLFLTVRPAKRALLILLNLAASLLLLSGALWLADIPLNVMNIAIIPIILGTGIDCYIHFSHRFDEEDDLGEIIRSEVPPIFISSLTSIVGFGGLVLTSSVGLRSVGWVAVLGLSIVTLMCAFVFPRCLLLSTRQKTASLPLKNKTQEI